MGSQNQVTITPDAPVTITPDATKKWSEDDGDSSGFGGGYVAPTLSAIGNTAKEFGVGAAKGVGSTVAGTSKLMRHLPGGKEAISDEGLNAFHDMVQPKGLAQQAGFGTEQAAEYLLPGGLEEKAGATAAKLAPKIAKYAAPAARIGTRALTAGAQTAMQTGSPEDALTGAAVGGGTGIIGEAAHAAAPAMAESALGVRATQKLHGKTPGPAALDELSGVRMGTLEKQAGKKMTDLNAEKDALIKQADDRLIQGGLRARPNRALPPATQDIPLHEAKMPEMPGGLYPAETRLNSAQYDPDILKYHAEGRSVDPDLVQKAGVNVTEADLHDPQYLTSHKGPGPGPVGPYEPGVMRRPTPPSGMFPQQARMALPADAPNLNPVVERIHSEIANPEVDSATKSALHNLLKDEIAPFMTADGKVLPSELDHLKVRLGKTISSWDRMKIKPSEGFEQSLYGNLDHELDRVVGPQHAELNQRISSLVPVSKRAELAELQHGPITKALERFGARTGALTGSVFGAHEGYKRGGVKGGIVGGLAGLVVPELLADPAAKMLAARAMKSPTVSRGLTGIAEQAVGNR